MMPENNAIGTFLDRKIVADFDEVSGGKENFKLESTFGSWT
jgi:hypothetical protein